MKKYGNYLLFNDTKAGRNGGEASRAGWRVWTASSAVLSRPLLWLGECSCVGLIFDRVFQFVRDDFKILLISDGLCSILIIIDGVKSQKHRIKQFFFSFPRQAQQERLNALAMISVEKISMNNMPGLNEKVIDLFAQNRNRRMDFLFKQPKPALRKSSIYCQDKT